MSHNISERVRFRARCAPQVLVFQSTTEAPVGIEPTNGGFAVLLKSLWSFASCPNLCADGGLAHIELASIRELWHPVSLQPSQNLPTESTSPEKTLEQQAAYGAPVSSMTRQGAQTYHDSVDLFASILRNCHPTATLIRHLRIDIPTHGLLGLVPAFVRP